jgi:hypothetical protein
VFEDVADLIVGTEEGAAPTTGNPDGELDCISKSHTTTSGKTYKFLACQDGRYDQPIKAANVLKIAQVYSEASTHQDGNHLLPGPDQPLALPANFNTTDTNTDVTHSDKSKGFSISYEVIGDTNTTIVAISVNNTVDIDDETNSQIRLLHATGALPDLTPQDIEAIVASRSMDGDDGAFAHTFFSDEPMDSTTTRSNTLLLPTETITPTLLFPPQLPKECSDEAQTSCLPIVTEEPAQQNLVGDSRD